jgi:hypothetical protein
MPTLNQQNDLYFMTYKVVTERFQYYLQDISRSSGATFRGIIVADHRGKHDDTYLRVRHQELVENESAFTSAYKNLIEGLFLTPSHMSVGIQFADLVAGTIWRRFSANDDFWFEKIKSCLRTSPAGKIDGYGIVLFPKAGWTGPIEN